MPFAAISEDIVTDANCKLEDRQMNEKRVVLALQQWRVYNAQRKTAIYLRSGSRIDHSDFKTFFSPCIRQVLEFASSKTRPEGCLTCAVGGLRR